MMLKLAPGFLSGVGVVCYTPLTRTSKRALGTRSANNHVELVEGRGGVESPVLAHMNRDGMVESLLSIKRKADAVVRAVRQPSFSTLSVLVPRQFRKLL